MRRPRILFLAGRRLVLLWTVAALLLPTLYFKKSHLQALYPGGFSVVLKSAVERPGSLLQRLYAFAFYWLLSSILRKVRVAPWLVMAAAILLSFLRMQIPGVGDWVAGRLRNVQPMRSTELLGTLPLRVRPT